MGEYMVGKRVYHTERGRVATVLYYEDFIPQQKGEWYTVDDDSVMWRVDLCVPAHWWHALLVFLPLPMRHWVTN